MNYYSLVFDQYLKASAGSAEILMELFSGNTYAYPNFFPVAMVRQSCSIPALCK